MDDEQQKWTEWRAAEDRAAAMWADPMATPQQCQAASWEAKCAQDQWSNAADAMIKARAA